MKYLIANWKSHKNLTETKAWFQKLDELLLTRFNQTETKIIVAVPFPFLEIAQQALAGFNNSNSSLPAFQDIIQLAVQDISPFNSGSYTGAVSARQVRDFGVAYVIVGHSERRRYFKETSIDVANKIDRCLETHLVPIVCVDEPYLEEQADLIPKSSLSKTMIAYEALATIGTEKPLDPQELTKIKTRILDSFGQVPLIYGGSVKSDNVANYQDLVSGYLVGGASLDPSDFVAIFDRLHRQ
jgi:triosephosphate isomerase (TIM)